MVCVCAHANRQWGLAGDVTDDFLVRGGVRHTLAVRVVCLVDAFCVTGLVGSVGCVRCGASGPVGSGRVRSVPACLW